MIKKIIYAIIAISIFISAGVWAQEKKPVYNVITVNGIITSPTAKYIAGSIEDAQKDKADGLIILLDTPGGMDTAMRDIAMVEAVDRYGKY